MRTIIGVDPHPDSHTLSALDPNGRVLGSLTVRNAPAGFEELLGFARRFPERRWAIEGASNPFVRPWAEELVGAGEEVVSVPPSLTSRYRGRTGRKKNDLVDAQNAARALLADPGLAPYAPSPERRRLQQLSRTRRRLAGQLKANRMALEDLPEGSAEREVLRQTIRCLSEGAARLHELMAEIVKETMPEILSIRGVGPLLGAHLLAEVGDVSRFADADRFASYCGGPVERSSGRNARASVNPGGNRTLNWVVHMIAQVRLRTDGGRSRALVERKMAEGKTLRAALRVLKTYIARELYRTLRAIQEGRWSGPLAA